MRRTALALLGAAAVAFGGMAAPADVLAKDPPKTVKVQVKKAPKTKVAKYQSKCKPGQKWNATASLNGGACEKRVAKVKVKKAAPKAAQKPADKPAQIKKVG
jgi:hypothetical protein